MNKLSFFISIVAATIVALLSAGVALGGEITPTSSTYNEIVSALTNFGESSFRYVGGPQNPPHRHVLKSFALAEHNLRNGAAPVPGLEPNLRAVSGDRAPAGYAPFTPAPGAGDLPAFSEYSQSSRRNVMRTGDAEYKILNQVYRATNAQTTGQLNIRLNRAPCASCNEAIAHFRTTRPNIQLNIHYLNSQGTTAVRNGIRARLTPGPC